MSMVYCSRCGKLVNTAAGSCCRCGEPIADLAELERSELRRMKAERFRTALFIAAVISAAILAVYLMGRSVWR